MTRSEHVAWCKERALAYLPADTQGAVASMLSDMRKHAETRQAVDGPIGMISILEAAHGTPDSVRRFIEGFN